MNGIIIIIITVVVITVFVLIAVWHYCRKYFMRNENQAIAIDNEETAEIGENTCGNA